jgi:hypothetical protein
VIDVPETLHSQRECIWLQAPGRCTDDDSGCTLLVIHEAGSLWASYGLSKAEMIALAEAILVCAR